MPNAPLSVTFRDRTTKAVLEEFSFQLLPVLPRVGERIVLPEGQSGRIEDVEWRLRKSRLVGVGAEVCVEIALDADSRTG